MSFTGNERATRVTNDSVTYHDTEVFRVNGEHVTLNSGGWWTFFTKHRINQAFRHFNIDAQLYQENWTWYLLLTDMPNGMVEIPWVKIPQGDMPIDPHSEDNIFTFSLKTGGHHMVRILTP